MEHYMFVLSNSGLSIQLDAQRFTNIGTPTGMYL